MSACASAVSARPAPSGSQPPTATSSAAPPVTPAPTPTPTPPPPTPPALPVATAIGQVVAVSFGGTMVTPGLRHLILDDKVGTVLLFSDNFVGAAGLRALSAQLEELGREAGLPAPLLITLDQEGGSVVRLDSGIHQLPSEEALASAAPATVRAEVAAMAAGLRSVGVALDLAPVADLRTNPRDTVIGDRSFGPSPAVAAPRVAAYVEGLQDGGVGATLKHFPGLGGQAGDPHQAAVTDDISPAQWAATSEQSFAAGVAAGADAVMTTSLVTPNLASGDRPALLSSASVRMLRDDLHFGGVVVTDSLTMAAVGEPLVQAATDAAAAGNDLLLLGSADTTVEDQAVQALRGAVASGALAVAQVEASAQRVDALRTRYLGAVAVAAARSTAAEVERGIAARGTVPPSPGAPARRKEDSS